MEVEGDPWFILTSKLKRVKSALKNSNIVKGNLHDLVENPRNNLKSFQNMSPLSPSTDQLLEDKRLCDALVYALSNKEILLKQKSRVTWLHLGDCNNRYFFNFCKSR